MNANIEQTVIDVINAKMVTIELNHVSVMISGR